MFLQLLKRLYNVFVYKDIYEKWILTNVPEYWFGLFLIRIIDTAIGLMQSNKQ